MHVTRELRKAIAEESCPHAEMMQPPGEMDTWVGVPTQFAPLKIRVTMDMPSAPRAAAAARRRRRRLRGGAVGGSGGGGGAGA